MQRKAQDLLEWEAFADLLCTFQSWNLQKN